LYDARLRSNSTVPLEIATTVSSPSHHKCSELSESITRSARPNFFRKSAFNTKNVVHFAQCSTENPPTQSGIGVRKSALSLATAERTES